MEVMELADLRKAFMPSKDRYVNPHREAIRLRTLWTFDQRSSRSRDSQRVQQLFIEATKFVEIKDFPKALCLISKALFIDPRHHFFYTLRADIFAQQDKLDQAIHNYEEARKMAKFDKKMANGKSSITSNLIDVYRRRGMKNYKEERFMEAAGDLEQILVLRPYGIIVTEIQDRLLKTLRKMDKYEAFRCEWTRFMKKADPIRASSLLAQHAEYKIFRREIQSARHILFEAIDLDSDNARAHELLQVVYDTGHHLVAFSIMWSVHGCHDKALMAIEKARDCDPYNPGYTLLKAIVLRLSGRLLEAAKWLESVDQGFHKLLEPSRDKQGSIMGNLTIEQTRVQLVKQWHLIRYDIAVQFMLEERYEEAVKILQSGGLRDKFPETYTLMGDCMYKLGKTDAALSMYLKSFSKFAELKTLDRKSRKNVHLVKILTDIMNQKCNESVEDGRSEDAIKIANDVARIIDYFSGKDSTILGQNLGESLICKARAHYRAEKASKKETRSLIAEGFKLARGNDDHGIYGNIFNGAKLENVLDTFATARKLPKSLKLLMQYS